MWKDPCLVDLLDDNKQETSKRIFASLCLYVPLNHR